LEREAPPSRATEKPATPGKSKRVLSGSRLRPNVLQEIDTLVSGVRAISDGWLHSHGDAERVGRRVPQSPPKKHIEPPDRPVPALWPQPGANTGAQIAQPGTRSQRTAQVANLQWRGVRTISVRFGGARENRIRKVGPDPRIGSGRDD